VRGILRQATAVSSLCLVLFACEAQPGQPAAESPPTSRLEHSPTDATTRTTLACTIPDRLRAKDVSTLPVSEKVIALTFDGGSNAAGVRSILDTLAARHAPATFFLTGRFVRSFPGKSARIAREHLVGNHTDSHADLTRLSDAAITTEVRTAQRTILQVTGEDPRRFFRFPFGARTPHTISVLNRLCYVPFRWTVDTLGWRGTSSGISVALVIRRVMGAARPGAIVLMHVGAHPRDRSTLDAKALPEVIRRLRGAGFKLVPLSRVLGEAP
jgi:peptidoglycan/xylan/chitin deacetylase (PgdA/CDA1 family)